MPGQLSAPAPPKRGGFGERDNHYGNSRVITLIKALISWGRGWHWGEISLDSHEIHRKNLGKFHRHHCRVVTFKIKR